MRILCVSAVALAMLVGSTVGVAAQDEDPTARPPIPSAGCSTSMVELGLHPGMTIDVSGLEHEWAMQVPPAHDGENPVPLWVQLHGVGGSGLGQVLLLSGAADDHGFVVAAPTESLGNAGWTWREEDPELDTSLSNPDIAFIEALLDHLGDDLCIDLARVYVAGYSGGGEGASVLGCVLEDRVAAVAPVAAMLDVGDACELDRPVPFLAIHGTADSTAYFDGGYSPGYNDFPVVLAMAQTAIPQRVTNVALRNGCDPEPVVEAIGDAVERWAWGCPAGAEVELVVIEGGRHDWPMGSGPIEATETIWEFFEQHPMPE